jgi:phenylacetate-CoA ligase
MARAMYAAGFRAGDLIHNCFSYHFTPAGSMMESGAHALGCSVFPAGTGQTEQQLQALLELRPSAYSGTPSFLKIIAEKATEAQTPLPFLRKALLSVERRFRPRCAIGWLSVVSLLTSAMPRRTLD